MDSFGRSLCSDTHQAQNRHVISSSTRSEQLTVKVEDGAKNAVTNTSQYAYCLLGCKRAVPLELRTENLCVLHFIQSIEQGRGIMRRGISIEKVSAARILEIQSYIKSTTRKLSEIATGGTPLSDELKNRILTNLFAMMNLWESVDRYKGSVPKCERREKSTEDIAQRAYEFYLGRGGEPGKDVEDWVRAENELMGSET